MKKNDYLFDLIKSLSQTEKRYFRLFTAIHSQSSDKNYLKLFLAVDRMKEYDEEKLRKKHKDENFIKYLPQEKRHLFGRIMNSLRSYHAESSVDTKIAALLHECEILLQKNLLSHSRRALENAKVLAAEYERYTDLIKVYGMEIRLLRVENKLDQLQKHSDKIYSEMLNYVKTLENTLVYERANVSIVLKNKEIEFVRSHNEKAVLDAIVKSDLFRDENNAISMRSKVLYNYILGVYHYLINDLPSSFDHFARHLDLLDGNEKIAGEQAQVYIRSLKNYLFLANKLGMQEKFDSCFERLEKFRAAGKNELDDILFSTYMFRLLNLTRSGNFEQAVKVIEGRQPEIDEIIQKAGTQGYFYEESIFVWFKTSEAWFAIGDFRKALRAINEYLNSENADIKADSYCMARIYSLIIYYELEKDDLLEYSVISTIRFLRRKERLYGLETAILNFISTSYRVRDSKAMRSAFKALRSEIKPLLNDPFEKNAFEYFDYAAWLDSKISGLTLAEEVLRRNSGE